LPCGGKFARVIYITRRYDVTGRTTAANRTLGTKGTHAFTAANTRIAFTAGGVSGEWAPGAVQAANLNGTWEFGWQRGPGGSLDCYSNPMDCAYVDYPSRMGPGLLARDGWHVHDDTTSTRLKDGGGGDFGVPWHDDALLDAQDLYFFAYGGEYAGLLGAYARLSGPIAMPPAAALVGGVGARTHHSCCVPGKCDGADGALLAARRASGGPVTTPTARPSSSTRCSRATRTMACR
jgi:hypothetical protein